jgi:thymidylate synthase (FAD)
MKLIKPSTEILTPINGLDILQTLEKVARTCYKSEDKITEDSAEKIVKTLISKGHEAMIEFFDITVKFICDRGVSHELVRHRIASFAQESTRYVNYSKGQFGGHLTFIIPSWLDIQEGEFTNVDDFLKFNNMKNQDNTPIGRYGFNLLQSEASYLYLIEQGWQPQQARSILPNSLKTEINIKMNLREWRHFFKLRTAVSAHPQMRELTIPLLEELKSKIPVIFDDITY